MGQPCQCKRIKPRLFDNLFQTLLLKIKNIIQIVYFIFIFTDDYGIILFVNNMQRGRRTWKVNIAYLMMLLGVLLWTKRRQAVIAGLIGGALYFAVDYGMFYLLLGTRQVVGADPFWFLLWLSISYGFTNFVWIWLWLDRDGHTLEWSILIVAGWLATALLSQNFGNQISQISIMRGTNDYHGIMALILVIGYGIVCIYNIRLKDKTKKIPVLWILAIGILVQFGWEFVLNITGIRNQSLRTLIVNSLLETNLGLPYLYFIHRAVHKRRDEALHKQLPDNETVFTS